jgi:large subunit ribosomal protein L24e
MPNCTFCANPIPKGTGILYAKKDGTIYYFCSSKCRKNRLKLGREGRRVKWTTASRLFKGMKKPAEEEKQDTKK